jgi:multicomponent Na+:H+ antiporter subunit A
MGFDAIQVLAVLAPFLLLPLAGWLGSRSPRSARLLAVVPAALAGWYILLFRRVASTGPFTASLPWAQNLGLSLSFHFDGLGLLFAILITAIGALIVLYSVSYLEGHPMAGRFQLTLFAFMGSMLGVVLADNLLLLFVFWELTGFTSYFLIAFDHERREARKAALQALLVTGAGGLAFLAAGIAISQTTGTSSLSTLRASGVSLVGDPAYGVIVGLVLLAAFTKSAQFPFHFWLPNAMEAPSPVSGYLHSATMVKAGIYLVARMTPLLGGTLLWTGVIAAAATITMVGAAYRSLMETDLKRILAYTTISALGVMMLLLSLGTPVAVGAALVYLVAHACYKGPLFLVSGAVDHETGTRDVTALAGLRHAMPWTAAAAMLAAVSMAGVPPLLGFVAKEGLYATVAGFDRIPYAAGALLVAAVAASAMLGAAALTAGVSPFLGRTPRPADAHEAPVALWLAPLVLASVGVVVGLAPGLGNRPFALAVTAATGAIAPMELALWHGLTPALLLSAITLALTLILYRFRAPVRARAWPRTLATERLYTHTLGGFDLLSRRIAPALQSASLRSYVRVIVATAVVLVLAAFAVTADFPDVRRWTPIRPHEAGVALLIMVAAVSAAVARTTMAAVLSLGGVGYGIALLYVLFSAPDLAATQFAVETLTVVIFVLVFYQLPGFDDVQGWLGRSRDAIIAGAAGVTIALLVLFTAASGTTSRLADYFIEAAPTLAHGRNVVNVILVDFRGFDTMGEITVLVTVAIGVRALLNMGRERRS